MKLSYVTLPLQRLLIALSGLQLGYFAFSYLKDGYNNSFPLLEKLFKQELAANFTSSGAWQSIVPFLGSTYLSIALISLFALFFRAGRELRLMLVGLSSVHLFMGIIRLTIAPQEFYLESAALTASNAQFVIGGLMLISALLPYRKAQ